MVQKKWILGLCVGLLIAIGASAGALFLTACGSGDSVAVSAASGDAESDEASAENADGSSGAGAGSGAGGAGAGGAGAGGAGSGSGAGGSSGAAAPGGGASGSGAPGSDASGSTSGGASGAAAGGAAAQGGAAGGGASSQPSPQPTPEPSAPTPAAPPPEPAPAPTCTISVDASSMGWGFIMAPRTVTLFAGDTVLSVLQRECQNAGIPMEFAGGYIEGIGGLYEFDGGPQAGWMYAVNGWYPNYGCNSYSVNDGDQIQWHYTLDRGSDVGGGSATG